MKPWNARSKFFGLLVCFCILGVILLSIGAVRLRDGMRSRQTGCRNALDSCRQAVAVLKNGLPEDQQETWINLVQQEPELCLRLTCGQLSHPDEKELR